jgi:hypothetical protein
LGLSPHKFELIRFEGAAPVPPSGYEISWLSALPARRGGPVTVSTRESKMTKCRHDTGETNHNSLITILLDLELSKKGVEAYAKQPASEPQFRYR